jgi:hypothetical protein
MPHPIRRRRVLFGGRRYLLLDNFVDADGTNLTAHSMNVGPGWAALNGSSYTIQSNRARSNDTNDNEMAADAGRSDVTVSMIVNLMTSTRSAGILFRGNTNASAWIFIIGNNATDLQLWEITAGPTFTQRGSYAVSLAANTDYTLAVVLSGPSISCRIDGVERIVFSSASMQGQTKFGMYLGGGGLGAVNFDNFQVTP